MAWPTPQDYNEAVQNPHLAFADGELQKGRPELTPHGLPRPITGGFASVYRLQCVQRDLAVRCFLRQFDDQQQRYAAISEHLARVRLPYTVGFTFLREGIRVRGQWYPILKMEWVHGEPLSVFIGRHLGDPNILLILASRWVQMMKTIQKASIAHGDLQHGNVFVVDGELRLIDYDGMYVPALSGQASHEVGHRNYQHPLRTESDFGLYLDNFSAWVIYVSLIALTVDPQLWQRFGGGDESLLFRRKDFERPEASDALHVLQACPDERVQSLANVFRSLLDRRPEEMPPLDGQQLPPPAHIVITCESCGQALRVPTDRGHGRIRCPSCAWQKDWAPPPPQSPLPPWVEDYVNSPAKDASGGKPAVPEPSPHIVDPSWIFDFLGPSGPAAPSVHFENSAFAERVLLAVSAIGALLVMFTSPMGSGASIVGLIGVVLVNLVLWVYRYRSEPALADLLALQSTMRTINESMRATERDIEAAEREKVNLGKQADANRARLEREEKAVEAKERLELDASQRALQHVLSSTDARRRALQQQEANELRTIQNDIGAKVAAVNQQIGALAQAEANDLTNGLRNQQQQHMNAYLRRFSVNDANISGLGRVFKSRLKAAGFQTAADIDLYRVQSVEGIRWKRARALATWRQGLESMARASMPQSLSQGEKAAIQAKYQSQRRTLENERDREQQRQKDEESAIRRRYALELRPLDEETRAAQAKTQRETDEVGERYGQQYRSFKETLSKFAKDTEDELRKVDDRISEARKKLSSLHWEKEKARRQVKAFEGIRFPKYVGRVFFG